MAKKYLLYIHDERFNEEPKKSELINQLLKSHYADGGVSITAVVNGTKNHLGGGDDTATAGKLDAHKTRDTIKFCKHNAVLGFCKKGCK